MRKRMQLRKLSSPSLLSLQLRIRAYQSIRKQRDGPKKRREEKAEASSGRVRPSGGFARCSSRSLPLLLIRLSCLWGGCNFIPTSSSAPYNPTNKKIKIVMFKIAKEPFIIAEANILSTIFSLNFAAKAIITLHHFFFS